MKSSFPALYSTLCPNALSSLISESYDLGTVKCKFLVRGVGDTYLVESPKDRFILRIYRATHRTLPQIQEEVKLLLALEQQKVSVSYPITDRSGKEIIELEAAEGLRYGMLFSYAPGKAVKLLNDSQLSNLGREMAQFHNVSSTISLGGARWHFNHKTTLQEPLAILQPALADDPSAYAWLQHTVAQVETKLSTINDLDFSKGYCHFDFLPKNFHFDNDRVTLFDFDFMGYGWLVNDIMTFWQHLTLDVFTGRMTQDAADAAYSEFIKAYRQYRSVSEQELSTVPYLAIGFWLFYMAFHTTHDQFYTFSQPSQVKAYIGVLKHIVKTYWDS
ncbi:phosphotransferase enzyme family protein [Pedobacter sp. GR22-6]|uniref:phosphotransferase enzyme family protein n=1 Tax=Pedobacter sp. GR22-6 TaxID=3127957 RepID=UPI00307F291B